MGFLGNPSGAHWNSWNDPTGPQCILPVLPKLLAGSKGNTSGLHGIYTVASRESSLKCPTVSHVIPRGESHGMSWLRTTRSFFLYGRPTIKLRFPRVYVCNTIANDPSPYQALAFTISRVKQEPTCTQRSNPRNRWFMSRIAT